GSVRPAAISARPSWRAEWLAQAQSPQHPQNKTKRKMARPRTPSSCGLTWRLGKPIMGRLLSWIRRSVARRVAIVAAIVAAASSAVVGMIVVVLVLRDASGAVRRDMLLVALAGGAGPVAAVAIATVVIVNRLLASALKNLTDSLRLAENGQWLITARSDRTDEIGDLSRAFDRLCKAV